MSRLGDLSPAGSVAVGIIVGLLSTSIQSVGLTLQRKSHLLEDEKEDELIRRPPYRRRRWQLGMSMFVIANLVGSTIQITTLPLPVLSTLQASGLVFNTICATLLLGERFTRWSFGGTVLVAGGALLIAMFGAIAEPSHTLDQLLDLLGQQQFILWMAFTAFLAITVLILAWILSRLSSANTARIRLWRGMCFGSISSILSAHSLLVAKSAVELIVRTIIDHVNQFNRWQSWIILIALLFLALSQLYFLHRGLKLCSTSVLYPFVFCVYNIIAILDGLIYFRQTDRIPPLHAGLIALGTVILLSGVLALSWRLGDEESSGPPPDAHTLLTPGMGIVEDTTTEDEATETAYDSSFSYDSEEEAAAIHSSDRTPLLPNGRLMTPKSKDNAILRLTKQRRQEFMIPSEAGDIWNELCDRNNPLRPQYRFSPDGKIRRASTVTYAAKKALSAEDSENDSDGYADAEVEDSSPSTVFAHKSQAALLRRHKRSRTIHETSANASSHTTSLPRSNFLPDGSSKEHARRYHAYKRAAVGTGHISPFQARHMYNQEQRRRWSTRRRSDSSPLNVRIGSNSSPDLLQLSHNDSPGPTIETEQSRHSLDQGQSTTSRNNEDAMTASYGAISTNSASSNPNRRRRLGRSFSTRQTRREDSLLGFVLDWWRRPRRGTTTRADPASEPLSSGRRRARTMPITDDRHRLHNYTRVRSSGYRDEEEAAGGEGRGREGGG